MARDFVMYEKTSPRRSCGAGRAIPLALFALVIALLLPCTAQAAGIVQRGTSTSASGVNTTSITIDKPAGVAEGDVMLAILANRGGTTPSTLPAGWTSIGASTLAIGRYGEVAYKIATAADVSTTNYTFTVAAAPITGAVGTIVAFTGVRYTGTFNATGAFTTGTNNPFSVPAITTTLNNSAVILLASDSSQTWTDWVTLAPGSLTLNQIASFVEGSDASVGAALAIMPVAGSTGAGQATQSASGEWGAMLVALAPDSTNPLTASVTAPSPGLALRTATVPTFAGSAADDAGGSGLNADTTTYTMQRPDLSYWNPLTLGWQVGTYGLATAHSATSDGATAAWTSTATMPNWNLLLDGTYTLQATVTDKAGNSITGAARTFILDNTPPSGTVTINSNASNTATTSVSLGLAASDNVALADMSFSDDGVGWSAWEPYAATKAYTLPAGDGAKTVYVRFQDSAGNISSAATDTITLDTTGPTGTITINSGASYTNAPAVTLDLSATDGLTGVPSMQFSDDGSSWGATVPYVTSYGYTLPAGDGSKTVYVRFVDGVGNTGPSASHTIVLDETHPVITVSGVSNGVSYTASVTPTFSATDANLASVVATLDGNPFTSGTEVSSQGPHTLVVIATDDAGNTSVTTVAFTVDTVDPVITVSGVADGALYDAPVTPVFSATDDNLSAVTAVLDGNSFASGTTVSIPGTHTLVVLATDAAGNSSTTSVTFTIDTSAPVITVSGVADGVWYTTPVTPTFSATDDNLASVTATLDGNAFTSGTEVSSQGAHTLVVTAIDTLGHSATSNVTFTIDTIMPVVTVTGVSDGVTYNVPVAPTFSATDDNLTSVVATLDGSPFASGTTVSTAGSHTLVVIATDAAGNTSTTTTTFTISLVGPSTSWTYPSVDSTTVTDVGPVALQGTATDGGLGVAQVVLKISRGSDGAWWNGSDWDSTPTSLTAVGSTTWSYAWMIQPASQDGTETYTLASYGVDTLGSVGPAAVRSAISLDNLGPRVVSAMALDATHADVTLTEPIVDSGSLSSAFALDNGLSVLGATLGGSGKVVHLVTDTQSVGVTYTVTATLGALADEHGNSNIAPNTAQFQTGAATTIVVSQGADLGWPSVEFYAPRNAACVLDEYLLSAYGGASIVNTITVRGLDTSETLSSDVSSAALYVDNGDGFFGDGDLPLGAEGSFSADASGTAITFGLLGEVVVPGSPVSVWLVFRTGASAEDGHELGSRVEPGDVEVESGTVTSFDPIASANGGKTIGLDSTTPSTEASGVASGWTSADTTVTLVASDNFSGVVGTWFTRNGSSAETYTVPFLVSDEGTTAVTCWSQDRAGNLESPVAFDVRIDKTSPSTPATPTASALSTGSAAVSWPAATDAVSGVSYYEVLANHSVVATTASTSVTISSLATETIYDISVIAVDQAGNPSGESSATSVFTLAASVRPSNTVYARSVGTQGVFVDWGESTGTVPPVSYRVWRSVGGGDLSAIATISAGTPRSYTDASAPRFENLGYAVSVVDARGEGERSLVTTYSSTEASTLPAPVRITVKNTNSVLITWTPVPDPSVYGYHVYRATTSTGTPSQLTTTPTVEASYHDTSTADYAEYWYRVATVDTSGNVGIMSPPSYIRTEASATTDAPHGSYAEDTDFCALCHATHAATALNLLRGTTTIDAPLCLSCHDGTSASDVLSEYADDSRMSRHAVPVGTAGGTLVCANCHAVHSADQSTTVPGLLAIKSVNTGGNEFCYGCHGETAGTNPGGDLRVFEGSAHATAVAEPASGTKVVCSSCHVAHSSREEALYPYANDDRCLACHSTSILTGGAFNIAERLSGADSTTRHDLLSADMAANGSRLSCANCHEPHSASATTPTVDPDNPSTTGGLSAAGTTLCLRCHDGTLPTSEQTSGWASAPLAAGGSATTVDIATAWTTNKHGGGASTDPHLLPGMGFSKGDELTCANCHDPHGSPNRFTLLDTVRSKSGTSTVSGLLVFPLPGGGADTRFFCASCHDLTPATHPDAASGGADLSIWPLDCTAPGCHRHVGNGL